MIKVLVVDDSVTTRELLVHILGQDPEVEVVGQASDGARAVEMAGRLKPDVITMDVVMPDMDGVEATRRIMASQPARIVMVTAHADSSEPAVAFEALKAGALEVVAKPGEPGRDHDWESRLVDTIKAIAGLPMVNMAAGKF
ncbi:MAG: response regulator [Desulfarculaceae bacterium]|nr:response regulator [Desulfarculaceae bacterium]MCF8072820.1 response regulator [Desulfarculaceae bacterium]MCF8100988.1 response regulator [Desulfarculaceae bacterium]MCF8115625.1 response regulator [Desulfarculaceae bacterium]